MTYGRLISTVFLAATLLPASMASALADKRVALLIGNSAYEGVTRLDNPSRDVELIGAALKGAGFDDIDTKLDLDRDGMVKALRTFEDESADADIAVVYFSGHGLEMNGENFLVPVDARLKADRDVEDETVTLSRMLRTVDGARRLKLVILDACRNNPFLANMTKVRSTKAVSRGLVEVEPKSADTLVAYAAKAGTVAWDGTGETSPFAQSLAKRLVEPGVDIRLALGKVRDDVLAATNKLQEPFAYGSLGGTTVSLADLPPAPALVATAGSTTITPPSGVAANACGDAAAHWAEARKFDQLQFYRKHVELFGSCAFGDFARAKVEELSKTKTAALDPAPKAEPAAAPVQKAAKPVSKKKSVKKIKPKAKPQAVEPDYVSREPVEYSEDVPARPRRASPIAIGLGFGGRGHGGISFGGGGFGVGF